MCPVTSDGLRTKAEWRAGRDPAAAQDDSVGLRMTAKPAMSGGAKTGGADGQIPA